MMAGVTWDPRWDLGDAFIPKERYTTRAFAQALFPTLAAYLPS